MPQTADQLRQASCQPCEGGVPQLSAAEAQAQLGQLQGWSLADGGTKIVKTWKHRDFATAMAFLNRVATVAEAEQHHPDLHLTGYNKVEIELTTHALGGLSANDFILAAKIDDVA